MRRPGTATGRPTRFWRFLVAVFAIGLVAAAACGGDGDSGGNGGGDGGDGEARPECAIEIPESAARPVKIRFWHQLQANNEVVLQTQVDKFNESQDDVEVSLLFVGPEMLTKYRAGLDSGDLPDMLQIEETQVGAMVDSGGTIPIQSCVDAAEYDLSDFIPRTIAFFTTEGVLRAIPWNLSNPILFYDKNIFEKAGLDPGKPPLTLEQVREYSQQIVDSGAAPHGIALQVQPFFNEFWYAKNGQDYVNNGNGREGRATKALLDNETGLAVWSWWEDMVESGLALDAGLSEVSPDHLLAIANGEAAMTLAGSSAVGPIKAVLESGQFTDVEVGAGPLPGIEASGGVEVGEGSLWILRGEPEKVAAAWKFAQYLVAPEQLVDLHLQTGYIPIRRSVAEDPQVQQLWEEDAIFRIAYDQLTAGEETSANAGAVIGNFQGVRDAVEEAIIAMLAGDLTAEEALAQAQREADAAIADYNARIGG